MWYSNNVCQLAPKVRCNDVIVDFFLAVHSTDFFYVSFLDPFSREDQGHKLTKPNKNQILCFLMTRSLEDITSESLISLLRFA